MEQEQDLFDDDILSPNLMRREHGNDINFPLGTRKRMLFVLRTKQ